MMVRKQKQTAAQKRRVDNVTPINFDELNKIEYDIQKAFKRIETDLLNDLMDSLDVKDITSVEHWKLQQLMALENYRKKNRVKYPALFEELNEKIEMLIRSKFYQGLDSEEKRILRALKSGYTGQRVPNSKVKKIYELNERKLEALIKATTNDLKKAEQAVLRKAEDSYRKIIFDAEVALNTGSITPRQAIDMATHDFLEKDIQAITYKNGSVHKISDYADMCVRTADKKAYLYGEGTVRREFGCCFIIMGKRGAKKPCVSCAPFVGQILIDDVYSCSKTEARKAKKETGYMLLSEAMELGLYHPRCKCIHSTWFPELEDDLPKPLTKEEMDELRKEAEHYQRENHINNQIKKYKRLVHHSKDPNDRKKYKAKVKEWEAKLESEFGGK